MVVATVPSPTPTAAELEVLRVLWKREEATVREVHREVTRTKRVGYTTLLKQMQVMYDKGLLDRSERFRSHVYRPRHAQSQIQKQLAQSLLVRAFEGSARGLLQSALAGRRVGTDEIEEIRGLLDELEKQAPSRRHRKVE